MRSTRTILDWLKYQRLHHYPALSRFDRESAMQRLLTYEREERQAIGRWPWVFLYCVTAIWLLMFSLAISRVFDMIAMHLANLLLIGANFATQYLIHRRIKRRVNAKIAAELDGGRLQTCYECGYDVRAADARCSECGASIRIEPIA